MVVSYFGVTFVHLLLGDGRQGSPGQLQSAHNGLKTLKGQWRTVVVHLDYPGSNKKRHKVKQIYSRTYVTSFISGNVLFGDPKSHERNF